MRYQSFLIKYAEIGIKGKNRHIFEEALVRQIVAREMKQALPLPGIDIEVGIDVGENWLQAH